MSDSSSEKEAEQPPKSFEDALGDVQKIVRAMEGGELTLEDSLVAYEKGIKRIRECHDFLNRFERKVEMLVGFDAEGNPVTEEFENEEMTLEQKQEARGRRRGAGTKKKKSDLDVPDGGLF